jgi:hypothetical protein
MQETGQTPLTSQVSESGGSVSSPSHGVYADTSFVDSTLATHALLGPQTSLTIQDGMTTSWDNDKQLFSFEVR